MRKLLLCLLIAIVIAGCSGNSTVIKITTFNIRLDTPVDSNNIWENRKPLMKEFLLEEGADLIGFQEVLFHQYLYLDSILPEYDSYGTGRNDGMKDGEMGPLFFRTERFTLLNNGTFWLSPTPEVPGSKGWGAVLPRIVTWGKFTAPRGNRDFYWFNTHFSHMSDSARIMSAQILTRAIDSIAGDALFIVSGDFNLESSSRAYEILTEERGSNTLIDAFTYPGIEQEGPAHTFTGFKETDSGRRIDYIFVKRGIEVLSYRTTKKVSGDLFVSDHWPVTTEIRLK